MSSRNLILGIATIAVVVVAWKISQQKAPETELVANRLYPELIEKINDVARFSIRNADNNTDLAKLDDQWVVTNRDNFPAKFTEVKSTLINLADTLVIEKKTSNPEFYAKIGVADIEQENSESVLIHLEDADGNELASVVIGNERSGNNLETPNFYVRKSSDAVALLVEGDLDVSEDPTEWMDTDVINIEAKRVQKVSINRTGESPIIVFKESPSENFFSLQGIPSGFTASSRSVVSSFGALLLNVKFDSVAAASKLEGLVPRAITEVQTFDGLVATLEQFDYQEHVYIRFRFAFNPDIVIVAPDVPEALAAALDSLNKSEKPTEAEAEVSVEDEVAALNAKVANWVYALPDYKVRILDKKFDELVKPEEVEKKSEEPAQSK